MKQRKKVILEDGGADLLAEAIIAQAGIDYLEIRKEMYYYGETDELMSKLNGIIKFFHSKRYITLTDVDPDWLIEQLEKGHEKWVAEQESQKNKNSK